jgi:transposase-like protein
MRPDNKKIAAIAMLTAGQATLSEVARLAGTSRQRVQHWARCGIEHKGPPWPSSPTSRLDLDVKAARDGLLARQWAAELRISQKRDSGFAN